jgi:Leucine-rich repeat (LRR) protein
LTGSLPTELNTLTLLNYLNLNVNHITGTIPPWIGDSLHRLQALGLSDNLLEGSIPATLGYGPIKAYLKSLSLDGNMLTGDLAPLQQLRYLEYLYLNDNNLVGRLDHGLLADMNFLQQVDLSGNQISNSVPRYLFNLNQLQILDLSNNQLTGSLPSLDMTGSTTRISSLEFISFRNNSLSGSIPETLIPMLPKLYHLDLSFNLFTGDCPNLDRWTSLAYFFVGDTSLTFETIPPYLQSLTNLRELSMRNLGIQGSIPVWLETLEHLRLLDLSENQLSGRIDTLDFTLLKHLRYLILHDNLLTGSLPSSLATLQNLLVLSLHRNNITDDSTTTNTTTVAAAICSNATMLELMTVDCEEIICPCCDECCNNNNNNEASCFEGVVWETLEHFDGQWEEHFARSDYSFNPHVTLTGAHFEGKLGCGDDHHCG